MARAVVTRRSTGLIRLIRLQPRRIARVPRSVVIRDRLRPRYVFISMRFIASLYSSNGILPFRLLIEILLVPVN